MYVTEIQTGLKHEVSILEAEDKDYKILTKSRFFFNWKDQKTSSTVYKLVKKDDNILGAMALLYIPQENRIEISLLAVSKENKGTGKIYENIAGCLIAYACEQALFSYGELACISLIPKTELKSYYMSKYGMLDAGWQLFVEGKYLLSLIQKYS